MSEQIVNQAANVKREKNNNSKKNVNPDSVHDLDDCDEVGEEFDFSDSDLEEFEDCDMVPKVVQHSNAADNDRLTVTTINTTTTTTAAATTTTTPTTATTESSITEPDVKNSLSADLPVEKISAAQSLDDVISETDSKTKTTKNIENEHPPNGLVPATIHTEVDDDDDDYYSDEPQDELIVQFLGEANRIAEARLTARRQARSEAREIRMRELERQQKHQENNADKVFDMHTTPTLDSSTRTRVGNTTATGRLNSTRTNSLSSRRSSEDSLEEEGRNFRDSKQELKDAEERYRKAMIANAQFDNERASQTYQIQHLKDQLEEIEELNAQVQRELKEKTRDCNALQRNLDKRTEELKLAQGQLNERDALIADQGLVIVAVETDDGTDAKRALISAENAQLLSSVQGSLDVRLKRFNEEKQQLKAEIIQLTDQLENYKSKELLNNNNTTQSEEECEAQREANKIISDYKFRLQKAEQDISSLQANLARSETQLERYKSAAEAAEKAEAELKGDRRKLQREHREATERLEELETSNKHLLKRLDKLKTAKSALLKDL